MYKKRRGGRVVEGARLESVYAVKGIKGSNPFLSAIKNFYNNNLHNLSLKQFYYPI